MLTATNNLNSLYQKIKHQNGTQPFQKHLQAYDNLIDTFYLSESLISYAQDITGETFRFARINEYDIEVGIFSIFATIALLKTASAFKKLPQVDQYYKAGRILFSGIKNGRHAFINSARLFGNINGSMLSPIGGIAFSIGILTAINNHFKDKLEQKIAQRAQKINDFLDDPTQITQTNIEHMDYLSITPPNMTHNKLLLATSTVDGITDGLYVVGNVVGLLALISISTGGLGCIPLGISYLMYTVASTLKKTFKNTEEIHKDKLKYLDFLIALKKNQHAFNTYHQKHKESLKKNFPTLNEDINIETLQALKEKHEQKYQVFKLSSGYKTYQTIDLVCGFLRDNINYLKNSLAAVAGINIIAKQNTFLSKATHNTICLIVGASLAIPLMIYKSYQYYRKIYPSSPSAPKILQNSKTHSNTTLAFLQTYNQKKWIQNKHHHTFIQQLSNTFSEVQADIPLTLFSKMHQYIYENIKKINKKGALFQRYKALKSTLNDFVQHKSLHEIINEFFKNEFVYLPKKISGHIHIKEMSTAIHFLINKKNTQQEINNLIETHLKNLNPKHSNTKSKQSTNHSLSIQSKSPNLIFKNKYKPYTRLSASQGMISDS